MARPRDEMIVMRAIAEIPEKLEGLRLVLSRIAEAEKRQADALERLADEEEALRESERTPQEQGEEG